MELEDEGVPDALIEALVEAEALVEEVIDFRNLAALVAMHGLLARGMDLNSIPEVAVGMANALSCALEPVDDPLQPPTETPQ